MRSSDVERGQERLPFHGVHIIKKAPSSSLICRPVPVLDLTAMAAIVLILDLYRYARVVYVLAADLPSYSFTVSSRGMPSRRVLGLG